LRVLEGEIVRMKLYDVAEEIRLEALAPSMFEGRLPVRQPLSRAQIQSIELVRPPMVVELGERESSFETGRERVRLGARFYEVGVVALVAHFPVRDLPQEDFIDRALKLDYDPRVDELLDRELRQILGVMGDAVVGAHDFEGFEEEFAFYVLRRTDRPIRRENLEEFPELVAMLHGESRSLSGQQTALLCENSLSFFENDLVVLNYDNALVVDDADPVDILLLVEYAVAQVLEARYYDETLNDKLRALYREMDKKSTVWEVLFTKRYRELTRRAMKLMLETRLATDHLTSSVRVTEDVYYAQVYNRALRIFRTGQWLANVEEKLRAMKEACDLMEGEIHTSRSTVLEWIVILLIALEVIPLFLHLK